jgi:hypothetical protein
VNLGISKSFAILESFLLKSSVDFFIFLNCSTEGLENPLSSAISKKSLSLSKGKTKAFGYLFLKSWRIEVNNL